MNVVWSSRAIERIVEIGAWIAADRPKAAEKLIEDFFAAVDRLHEFPESGRKVLELDRPELREIIHRKYRIIYRKGSESVEILTVRHSLQLLDEDELED